MAAIVQYIIVRSDLRSALNWPLGAVIAQCCHATAAVLERHKDDELTRDYLKDLANMHKVVLQVKDEAELLKLEEKLTNNSIQLEMWIEHPENIPTCIAIKPYFKESVHPFVKHLKLLKDC